jgi:hypothetical protein
MLYPDALKTFGDDMMYKLAMIAGALLAFSTVGAVAQTKLVLPASGAKMTLATTEVSGVHFAAQIAHTTGQGQDLCQSLEVLDRADKVVNTIPRGETRMIVTQNAMAVKCNEAKRGTVEVVYFPAFK